MAGVIPDSLTIRELIWMAGAKSREDWQRMSSLMALHANINRDEKKHPPFKPSDFNPHEQQKKQGVLRGKDLRVLKDIFVPQN